MSNSILAIGIVAIIAVCAVGGGIALAMTDTDDYATGGPTDSPVHETNNNDYYPIEVVEIREPTVGPLLDGRVLTMEANRA